MNAKAKTLIYSSLIGYLIFLVFPIGLSVLAISEGIGVYTIIIITIDALLLLPMILFVKKKEVARLLFGIYSVVLFIIFAFLPVAQHKVDLTLRFYTLYGVILFLFAYIFYIMFFYRGTKEYFKEKG